MIKLIVIILIIGIVGTAYYSIRTTLTSSRLMIDKPTFFQKPNVVQACLYILTIFSIVCGVLLTWYHIK